MMLSSSSRCHTWRPLRTLPTTARTKTPTEPQSFQRARDIFTVIATEEKHASASRRSLNWPRSRMMDIFSASDLFLAAWCSQMSALLRWLEGAGTIWAVSRREKSFYRHLTLGLTHYFLVPANVLMRQNVFRGANFGRRLGFLVFPLNLRSWHPTLFNGTIHLTNWKFAFLHFFFFLLRWWNSWGDSTE